MFFSESEGLSKGIFLYFSSSSRNFGFCLDSFFSLLLAVSISCSAALSKLSQNPDYLAFFEGAEEGEREKQYR